LAITAFAAPDKKTDNRNQIIPRQPVPAFGTARPAVKRALPLAETKNRAIDETARNQSQNKN
jgi:hypothetical protein